MIAGTFLPDTSALSHAGKDPVVAHLLDELTVAGLLATCLPLDLEAGFSARSPKDYELIAAHRRELLVELPNTPEVARTAREIQRALARTSQHRGAGGFDVMIAAFALTHEATILHRDGDYELIAGVTGQAVERVGA